MKTLGQQLEEYNNFGPGFNFARLFLAYSVLVWHAVAIAENRADQVLQTPIWPLIFSILPMFFALSGFLVTGSALRLPLREYILNRVFRIVPALGVDIFISALIIGPVFTTFALTQYFYNPDFFEYFTNIFGRVQYDLPGVFLDNPYPGIVNGALWTVPYEIACYFVMSGLIFIGVIRSWRWVLGAAVSIVVVAIALYLMGLGQTESIVDKFVRFAFFTRGATLVPSFLAGSAIYLLKDKIPYNKYVALLVIGIYLLIGWLGGPELAKNPIFIGFSAFPLAYLIVWIGLTPIWVPAVVEKGDYSYGIYLYHFPILQAITYLFGFPEWWMLAIVSVFPVTIFAMFSWHSIEKPTLKMRKRFSLVGARIAAS